MTQAIAHTYTLVHDYRRQITLALCATCAVLALVYAVNLYRVISYTISLQHMHAEQVALDASIQALDTQYLAISSKITPDTLSAYGFGQATVHSFISRTASLGRVALVGHEL